MRARLDRLNLSGFKSIHRVEDLHFGPLNIMVGANGAGKSNLLAFFRLLNFSMTGGLQLFVARSGGANRLLHFGAQRTPQISARLVLRSDQGTNAYALRLFHAAGDTLVFADEEIDFRRTGMPAGRPQSLGGGHMETRLGESTENGNTTAQFIKGALNRWNHYHFHDTSDTAPVKQAADVDDNRYLRTDAANLAAFLYWLREDKPDHYRQIRDTVRLAAPFFDDFDLEPDRRNRRVIRLVWREIGEAATFDAFHLSDGTLRFICLCALLLQPAPPELLVVDEPELGLHPFAMNLLASMLQSASERTQVIVSTQSVNLVDHCSPEDVIVVDREEGASIFRRLDHEQLEAWLEEYTLGQIWEKNLIGGRPGR